MTLWFFLLACDLQAQSPEARSKAKEAEFSVCAGWSAPTTLGSFGDKRVKEASGLAVSRRDPKRLWTHNDHGSKARLFAAGLGGVPQHVLDVEKVSSRDWEDIASGEVNGEPVLFVANTGNNDYDLRVVEVLRIVEPATDVTSTGAAALKLRWPKEKLDVESLGWDPVSGDLLLASKEKGGARFFRASATAESGSEQVLQGIGRVVFDGSAFDGGRKATAMDFSPDGMHLFLRTAKAVVVWERDSPTMPLGELLLTRPCLAPSPIEPDSEALAATPEGFLTTSEGVGATVWAVRRTP